jgi:hypothetical protein
MKSKSMPNFFKNAKLIIIPSKEENRKRKALLDSITTLDKRLEQDIERFTTELDVKQTYMKS